MNADYVNPALNFRESLKCAVVDKVSFNKIGIGVLYRKTDSFFGAVIAAF